MKEDIAVRHRSGLFSYLIEKRAIIVLFILSGMSILLFLAGLSVGSTMFNPVAVIQHLLGFGNGENEFVIETLRMPRALLSLLVGAALGVSGLILQGMIRNPLGSPDVIGITGGGFVCCGGVYHLFCGAG